LVGWAEGRKRRQIHVIPEKVGTSFCLHFVLFSSRDYVGFKTSIVASSWPRWLRSSLVT
jgi:hypothetical protein